jgi:hypothetical protein
MLSGNQNLSMPPLILIKITNIRAWIFNLLIQSSIIMLLITNFLLSEVCLCVLFFAFYVIISSKISMNFPLLNKQK